MTQRTIVAVAEDEYLIASALEYELVEAGFDVVTFPTGDAAVQWLSAGGQPHVLLTDIRMPGAHDGWALAHRAREIWPNLPVIYVSGDSGASWTERGVPNSKMLPKPVDLAVLSAALRDQLAL